MKSHSLLKQVKDSAFIMKSSVGQDTTKSNSKKCGWRDCNPDQKMLGCDWSSKPATTFRLWDNWQKTHIPWRKSKKELVLFLQIAQEPTLFIVYF